MRGTVAAAPAAVVVVAALLAGGCGASAGVPAPAGDRWFAAGSLWNRPVPADAALDPRSASLVAKLAQQAALHTSLNTTSYSTPVYRVGPRTRRVPVTLDGTGAPLLRRAVAAVPLPLDARAAAGTDANAVVYQRSTDTVWEFWRLRRGPAGFAAGWAGRMEHVSQSPGYFRDVRVPGQPYTERRSWGATASKLAKLGGLVTAAELRRGHIDHALALGIPRPRAGWYALPAQATDGTDPSGRAIPEGAHFRLDPRLDLAQLRLPPVTLMLARAAQRYGIVVNNGSGSVSFYAEDPRGLGGDPYPALFGDLRPHDIAAAFPWAHLQLLRMHLRLGRARRSPRG